MYYLEEETGVNFSLRLNASRIFSIHNSFFKFYIKFAVTHCYVKAQEACLRVSLKQNHRATLWKANQGQMSATCTTDYRLV
jgi:hypothetical protein